MPTDKQIAANRENAKKSTGPTSPHGKAISSMNALKSGIDLKSEFIRPESQTDLAQLTIEYYEDFTPANAAERALVDQLIRNEWLNRRYAAVEPALWERAFTNTESENLGRGFLYQDDAFMKLDRLRNSAQRNYAKALKELMALRKTRNTQPPAREPAHAQPHIPELGSIVTFPSQPVELSEPDEENPPIAA